MNFSSRPLWGKARRPLPTSRRCGHRPKGLFRPWRRRAIARALAPTLLYLRSGQNSLSLDLSCRKQDVRRRRTRRDAQLEETRGRCLTRKSKRPALRPFCKISSDRRSPARNRCRARTILDRDRRAVADFSPRIGDQLRLRDELQARIDAYHLVHRGKPFDMAGYEALLREIGYIVARAGRFLDSHRKYDGGRTRVGAAARRSGLERALRAQRRQRALGQSL